MTVMTVMRRRAVPVSLRKRWLSVPVQKTVTVDGIAAPLRAPVGE